MKKLFHYVIAFCFLSSCVSTRIDNLLNDIETYICESPDSALVILDSIDRSLLKTKQSVAHHALLHVMALDKNFIDVSDDSLSQAALNYYNHHGDKKYKARSLYYLGLSYYYSKEYDKAILEFTKAEEIAQKCDSLYWGMIKVAQADTYIKTFNEEEEYRCLNMAYDIYQSIGEEYYLEIAKLRLARSLANQKQFSKSDSLLNDLIYSDQVDHRVLSSALIDFAYTNVIRSDRNINLAISTYENVINNYDASFMSTKDYWALAYAYSLNQDYKKSSSIVEVMSSIDTSATASYWKYLMSKHNHDIDNALRHLEETVTGNDENISVVLRQSLSLKQRDYYAAQSELRLFKIKFRTFLFIGLLIFCLMILGYILIFFARYKKRQFEEKQRYIEYVAEITRQLDEIKNHDSESLKSKYINLYKSTFEILRVLCDQYLMSENRVDAEKLVYRKVVSLVNEIRNDKEHSIKLEAMLDCDLNGIMTNLRNELPRLKEIDYTIFAYWIIGFDSTTISRLLDTTINIVYIRKSRIKQQINKKCPEHMEQFLEMIS